MNTFSIVFLTFLALTLTTQLWLARRQIRHVSMFRHAVPDSFRDKISLAAHKKAADYTITNNRIGMVDEVYGTVILLGWTLAGGLVGQAVDRCTSARYRAGHRRIVESFVDRGSAATAVLHL